MAPKPFSGLSGESGVTGASFRREFSRAAVVVILLAIVWPISALSAASTAAARSIQVGSRQRTYLIHVPSAVRQGRPAGLVFALHGGGGTGRSMERLTRFNGLADGAGFIVVYPDAVERNWNDGRAAATIPAQRQNVDDVGFVAALITSLTREFGVDRGRVYVTGVSNGAFMSQRLGVELSDRIAAIAPVIGGLAPQLKERFAPKAPLSVLVMNGASDPLVPYGGGAVARNRGETIGVAEIIRLWVAHNHCPARGQTMLLPDTDPADGTRVRRTAYAPCAQGTAVVLYTIEGGGHTWPAGPQYLPRAVIGRTSRDIDATRVIWEFFAAHPRR
jgi:polyhydroxybutyrate depolymerase